MVSDKEYLRRRKRLMDIINEGSIAILPAAPLRVRNRDVEYPYRPDSDFYYLTGFPEPEAVAVFIPNRPQGEYVLFCRERDPSMEQWNGYRAGLEGACERYGADDAFRSTTWTRFCRGCWKTRNGFFIPWARIRLSTSALSNG